MRALYNTKSGFEAESFVSGPFSDTKGTLNLYHVLNYFSFFYVTEYFFPIKLGLVVDPVIKAITRLEFEDDLRTEVHPGGY